MGSVGVMAISSALEQNISLDRLDLSYCEIDDRGIQKLSTLLAVVVSNGRQRGGFLV